MYDVSAKHRSELEKNVKRMDEIKLAYPKDFYMHEEWIKLNEKNKTHLHHIKRYEYMIAMGVKF